MSTAAEEWADWCASDGGLAISGTRMREFSRKPDGETRWCFTCRKRRDFEKVISVPDGLSYYGPNGRIECTTCRTDDGDLFPGNYRIWDEV